MPDIYEIYTDIRAYWFDYGRVLECTRSWIREDYNNVNAYSVEIGYADFTA